MFTNVKCLIDYWYTNFWLELSSSTFYLSSILSLHISRLLCSRHDEYIEIELTSSNISMNRSGFRIVVPTRWRHFSFGWCCRWQAFNAVVHFRWERFQTMANHDQWIMDHRWLILFNRERYSPSITIWVNNGLKPIFSIFEITHF